MSARPRLRDTGGKPARSMTFAEIALAVVGAAVAVLALTAAAVALLPISPEARAGVGILGILASVAMMSVVSNRMSDRAVKAELAALDAQNTTPSRHTGTSSTTKADPNLAEDPTTSDAATGNPDD